MHIWTFSWMIEGMKFRTKEKERKEGVFKGRLIILIRESLVLFKHV